MAAQGRDGDTTLVHMTPNEVAQMQQLAQQRGGSLTINPNTGLPEASFLDDIGLGSLSKVAAPLIGAGAAYFGMDPITAGALVGGATALGTGDLSKGLQDGLGVWGGASLTSGLMDAGSSAAAREAAREAQAAGLEGDAYKNAVSEKLAKTSSLDKLSSGFSAAKNAPLDFLKYDMGNGSYLTGALPIAAAGLPALMQQPTVGTAAAAQPGYIRQSRYDPRTKRYTDYAPVKASEFTNFYAKGGVAKNYVNKNPSFINDSTQIYDYLTGKTSYNPITQANLSRSSSIAPPNLKEGDVYFDPKTGTYKTYHDPSSPPSPITNPIASNPTNPTKTGGGGKTYEDRQAELNSPNSYWGGLTQNQYFSLSPEERAAVDAQAKVDHPIMSGIGDLAKTLLVPGGMFLGALNNVYQKINPPPPVPPASDMTYPSDQAVTYDGTQPVNAELQKVIEGQPSIYDKGLMGVNTRPQGEATVWRDGSGNVITTGNGTPLMTGYGASILGQQEKDRATQSALSEGESGSEPAITREMQLNPDLWGSETDSAANEGVAGTSMQNALNSQALSAQNGLAGSAMQNAINSQNAAISASSPTATGGIANLAPAFGTTQPTNDGDAGEGAAAAAAAAAANTGFSNPVFAGTQDAGGDADGNNANSGEGGEGGEGGGGEGGGGEGGGGGGGGKKGGLAALHGFKHMAAGGKGTSLRNVVGTMHGVEHLMSYANGGYNLGSYSDGGRLLRGPGDGVSDSIPATIGHNQPARLADGEFVIPARIVSEIGNGSTDAGARKLYQMMARIQSARAKTIGKDRVATNTKADKYLPA